MLKFDPQFITPWTPQSGDPLWSPHDYQIDAVDFLLERLCGQLWLTPGLGKTTIALATFEHLRRIGAAKRMLIVAPLRVAHLTWPGEVAKWANFKHLSVAVLHGSHKEALWSLKRDICVINYEGLDWLLKQIKTGDFEVLVFDEISYLKTPTTKRFESVKKLIKHIPMRWGLTGSPASNHLLNIWGPQFAIDNGATLGANFWRFREDHFYPPKFIGGLEWEMMPNKRYEWAPIPNDTKLIKESPHRWYYEVVEEAIPGGRDRLFEKMKNKALSMNALDHLEMPKLVTNDIIIPLPSKLEKLYRELEKPWLHDIGVEEGATHYAVHGGVAQQFTSGCLYTPLQDDSYFYTFINSNTLIQKALAKYPTAALSTGRRFWKLHSEKIQPALDIVEGLQGAGALIAYNFEHELHDLKTAFPDAPVLSELSSEELINSVAKWNRGEIEVLLCQPKSVGHGLNLQGHGACVVWYSLTWSLEEYEQLIGRIWRQGQKNNTIVVHRLIIENSIDCDLLFAIDSKNHTQLDVIASTSQYVNEMDRAASMGRVMEAAKQSRVRSHQIEQVRQERLDFAKENADGYEGFEGT